MIQLSNPEHEAKTIEWLLLKHGKEDEGAVE